MVDFKAQLAKGFTAHEKASAAKAEVKAVLMELSKQVEEFTHGKVAIKLKAVPRPMSVGVFAQVARLSMDPAPRPPAASETILIAFDKKLGPHDGERLAYWEQSNRGYPCTLIFDQIKRDVLDRRSLENVLGELLASPETGRIISSIVEKSSATSTPDSLG